MLLKLLVKLFSSSSSKFICIEEPNDVSNFTKSYFINSVTFTNQFLQSLELQKILKTAYTALFKLNLENNIILVHKVFKFRGMYSKHSNLFNNITLSQLKHIFYKHYLRRCWDKIITIRFCSSFGKTFNLFLERYGLKLFHDIS